ncbi:MAG: type IV pilus assembly protein FimV [Gammaproteobacteria bacterium]
MGRRRTIISLQLILTFTASLFMLAAEAIQLGDIQTHSAIGQPLDATVGVWLTTKDKMQALRIKVSPDITYRSNSNMATIVQGMTAEFATTGNGTPYIQLRSGAAINEPALAFRVKVHVGENAVMQNYSLALNPASPVRSITSKRRSRPAAPITDANYTVTAGDTLWAIARRVGRTTGTGTTELVAKIFADNPHAFVNGNQNRLILGTALRLPLASNATAPSESTNPRTVVKTPAVATPALVTTPVPASIVAGAATAPPLAAAATVEASTLQSAEPRPPVDWRLRDPKLAAELERLRLKYRALKQQYDTQRQPAEVNAPMPAPAAETIAVSAVDKAANGASVAPGAGVSQVAESAADSVTGDNVAEVFAGGDAEVTAEVLAADARSASGLSTVTIVALICASLALLVLIAIATRKALGAMKQRRAEVAHHAREADFKAEVARKAANRVQMEGEVQRMLANRDGTTVEAAPTAVDASATPAAGMDADIDHNIAQGRYNEAEMQLCAVIAANPKNFSAKLRLLEVYYMIERVQSFCDVAEDLQVNHRGDLSDDEWRRVIRMGKITAPDRMPFSGPRALDTLNEAS